jgi:hypothetical protein
MNMKFKQTKRPELTVDEFSKFIELYKVSIWDHCPETGKVTYQFEKVGIQLKSSIRPVKEHEVSCNIVDLDDQTCSCEAFTRRHQQGVCKHIKCGNFAKQNNLMKELLEMWKPAYEL